MKDLVAQQVREGVNTKKLVDDLIAELANARAAPADGALPVHAPVLDEAALAAVGRADKISKMSIQLRKNNKVRVQGHF